MKTLGFISDRTGHCDRDAVTSRTFFVAVLVIVCGFMEACSNRQERPDGVELRNDATGYSFVVPDGWRITRKKPFTISGPAAELEEDSMPDNTFSLRVNAQMMQATALAAGLCENTLQDIREVEGDNWEGAYFVCRTHTPKKKTSSDLAMLIARSHRKYYLFTLEVPADAWTRQHAATLTSLSFGPR